MSFELCKSLTTADWIQVIMIVVTTVGIIISLIVSVKSLKQNSKMIEESTRPYIVFYKDTIDINNPIEYLVIENFGTSAGTITEMSYDIDLLKNIFNEHAVNIDLLKYFSNITLAPHQRYRFPINTRNLKDKTNFKIDIKYKSETNKYKETFDLNLQQDYSITFGKQHQSAMYREPIKELITLSNAAQELIKRL